MSVTNRKRAKIVLVAVFVFFAFIVIFPLDMCNMLIRKIKRTLAGRVRQ